MNKNPLSGLLTVSAGNIFASMVISGLLLGYFLDGWLATQPVFMLSMGALGLVGGFLRAHDLLGMRDKKDDEG